MIDIVQYEPEHIDEIMKNPRKWELKMSKNENWPLWKYCWKSQGPAYTLLVNGKPIGCAGVLILENNIGEAWMVWSALMEEYAKSIYSSVKRMLNVIVKTYKLTGVQAFVDPEFKEGKTFMVHLGFVEKPKINVCGFEMIRYWRES